MLAASVVTTTAQTTTMRMTLNDGTIINVPVDDIESITVKSNGQGDWQALTGEWMLVAAANGVIGPSGLPTPTVDSISFTATMPPAGSTDYGSYLYCHTEKLYTRTGQDYPANWRMAVERNEETKKLRIGWVLDTEKPVSSKEFMEQPEKYMEQGLFYYGPSSKHEGGDTGHRYIYLLSENIDTQRLEGMTLWSAWLSEDATEFTFPQNQEVYAVVSLDQPFNRYSYSTVGYFEIWASTRFVKVK